MTATTNAETLRQNKIRFSLIVEYMLAFVSRPKMVTEVKNLYLNFRKIV